MKKRALLATLSLLIIPAATINPSYALSKDNKFVAGAKKVGNGIMWGPKKIASGTKSVWNKLTHKK